MPVKSVGSELGTKKFRAIDTSRNLNSIGFEIKKDPADLVLQMRKPIIYYRTKALFYQLFRKV